MPSPGTGIAILESVIQHSPYSDFADDSLYAIANFHFRKKRYDQASENYRRLYLEYPDSEWSTTAKYQEAICSKLESQGYEYDPGSLSVARSRLVEYSAEHPEETSGKGISGQIAAIDEQLAQKLWNTVSFYERYDKIYSAAYCCRRLTELYPGTSYASKAQAWLDAHPETQAASTDRELVEDERPQEPQAEAPAPVAGAPDGGFVPRSHSTPGQP
jgi:outer membrane protein assembly factor BamD (BamD/ComL family)